MCYSGKCPHEGHYGDCELSADEMMAFHAELEDDKPEQPEEFIESYAADVTTMPTSELMADLIGSRDDAIVCEASITMGILEHNGISVQDRLDVNKKIMKIIQEELKRRGVKL